MIYVIMGVSGSGKTTVGRLLAKRLGCHLFDADNFHPPENVAKMAAGRPLNDEDRAPWLGRLHDIIRLHHDGGETAVVTCSALKQRYREQLRGDLDGVAFIHLAGSFDLIWQRLAKRQDHFMKAEMLQSQFDALEMPNRQEALIINIDKPPEAIVQEILKVTGNW